MAHRTFFKKQKTDADIRAEQKEEWLREKLAKQKIRGLDNNQCANPMHNEWRRKATDKGGFLKNKYVCNTLSVHRITYASHGGGYTPENGVTSCGFCHHCVQQGMIHKDHGSLSAHQLMLMWLRAMRKNLPKDRFRFEENYQILERRFGGFTL